MDIDAYFPVRQLKLVPEIRAHSVVKGVVYPVNLTNDNAPYALPYWHSQAIARFILDHPYEFAGRSVLDVGCGSGVAAIAAAMVGADAIALDPDLRCLDFTKRNATINGVTVRTVWGDHRSMPSADIIVAGGVFHEAHGMAIAEAARKQPSVIAVSRCNLWDMGGFDEVAVHEVGNSIVHVLLSRQEIRDRYPYPEI